MKTKKESMYGNAASNRKPNQLPAVAPSTAPTPYRDRHLNVFQRIRLNHQYGRLVEQHGMQVQERMAAVNAEVAINKLNNSAELTKAELARDHEEAMRMHRVENAQAIAETQRLLAKSELDDAYQLVAFKNDALEKIVAHASEEDQAFLYEKSRAIIERSDKTVSDVYDQATRMLERSARAHVLQDEDD